jgi:hypothetical protein|tara:strand:+ start:94 stop:276 length:183 start_codon:yes stop_codon:yes gene_type:complete
MEIAMVVNDKMILDDYEVSITIDVYDNAGNFMGEYHSEILDDKTVHAIIEQVAKLKGGEQ